MFFENDEFMEYAGFRNMLVEEKIEECLEAARQGETSFSIDVEGLSDAEISYLQDEVRRRIDNEL